MVKFAYDTVPQNGKPAAGIPHRSRFLGFEKVRVQSRLQAPSGSLMKTIVPPMTASKPWMSSKPEPGSTYAKASCGDRQSSKIAYSDLEG